MGVFYGTILGTYILSFMSRCMDSKKLKKLACIFAVFATLILIIVGGLQRGIGDTGMYMHSYELMVNDPSTANFDGDAGFTLLNLLLIQISTNPQTLVIVTAIIMHILNVKVFYKYRSYLELELYMYITSGYYIVTMNGMRQCLAAALLFVFNKYLVEGKFKKYLICILIISTIHGSALIMIPVYFIVRQEAWSKNVIKLIILACVGVVFYDVFSEILFKTIEGTQYGHYSSFQEGGSSAMRTVVNSVPLILAFIKRDRLKEKWPESNIFVNMALLNLIFVAFGMWNWIFNRFSLYFQLYNFILLPYIIKNCFKGKERRLIYVGFLICYFIFFYREQVLGLGMKYKSDYLNFRTIFYK
ncbi:MAG: EpsG family protein [Clostridium sp.]|uniref:EpsG family protein n=1 Tax=Clostridium sp. TaxID=1506 RepID=UPI002FC6410F